MNIDRYWFTIIIAMAILLIPAAPLSAQAPPAAPPTAILTNLTIKPGVDRAQVMRILPDEVRATVRLYLDGKIQQWYARSDGRGVVFIMNCSTVAEAKALMDALPLAKSNLVDLEYTGLGPLTPLRLLIQEPAPPAKDSRRP